MTKKKQTKNSKPLGVKFDDAPDKRKWALMPFKPLEEILKVLEHGAEKYAPDNWKYVDDAVRRYKEAGMRHLTAYMGGEVTDPDTGLSHMAHLGCNVLFLLWFEKNSETSLCIQCNKGMMEVVSWTALSITKRCPVCGVEISNTVGTPITIDMSEQVIGDTVNIYNDSAQVRDT